MDLTKFKEYLKNNNLAISTITNYCSIIKRYFNCNTVYDEVSVKTYLDGLKQTKESKNVSIKAFIAYSKSIGIEMPLPKICGATQKMPDYITLDYFENEIIPLIPRLFSDAMQVQAFMYLLAYTGIRIPSEIIKLPRSAFDLQERTVKIQVNKQKKERWAILPKKIIPILKTYFMTTEEKENALNLTAGRIVYIFRVLKEQFPNISMRSRLFRHSIATHLRREGADITAIMDLMGWKSIQSALPYLNNDKKMIKDLYDRYVK